MAVQTGDNKKAVCFYSKANVGRGAPCVSAPCDVGLGEDCRWGGKGVIMFLESQRADMGVRG